MFSQKTSMFEKVDNKAESTKKSPSKLRNKSKIRNWYNQILHLTQDTICKVTKTLENITYKRPGGHFDFVSSLNMQVRVFSVNTF